MPASLRIRHEGWVSVMYFGASTPYLTQFLWAIVWIVSLPMIMEFATFHDEGRCHGREKIASSSEHETIIAEKVWDVGISCRQAISDIGPRRLLAPIFPGLATCDAGLIEPWFAWRKLAQWADRDSSGYQLIVFNVLHEHCGLYTVKPL